MAVNRDEFFREVTLRICSSLQINTAFGRVFEYLREHFPMDHMFLDITDKNLRGNKEGQQRGRVSILHKMENGDAAWVLFLYSACEANLNDAASLRQERPWCVINPEQVEGVT